MIYFITSGEFVKIGVAKNPQDRLRTLQTGSPVELTLMAVIPGGYETEYVYHDLLDGMRVRGEWFKIDKRIASMIRLFSALFGIDGVDVPDARDAKISQLQSQIDEMNEDDDSPVGLRSMSGEMIRQITEVYDAFDEGVMITTKAASLVSGKTTRTMQRVMMAGVSVKVFDNPKRGVYYKNGVNPNEL